MDNKKASSRVEDANRQQEAHQLYEQARELWKQGKRAAAITAYEESAALDPKGPASTALDMLRDIMDFYDKSRYNP